jgi:triosephosphate isomerase
MAPQRTRAILAVLRRGREDKVAGAVLKIFGASSIEECCATYELVGHAERATLDEAVERIAANASAAFWLSVESEAS